MASSERQRVKRELHRERTTLMQEKEEAKVGCKRCSRHSGCDQTAESCGKCSAFAQYTEASSKLDEFIKQTKKVETVQEVKKPELTKEAYESMKNEGKRDSEIARFFGIAQPTLGYYKKKWFKDEQEQKEPLPHDKEISKPISEKTNQVEEYQKLMSTLQKKITSLEEEEKASRESAESWKKQFNATYATLCETETKLQQFEQRCAELKEQNEVLQSKNTELFNTNKSLNNDNFEIDEQLSNKVSECELHYKDMLELQRKIDTLENESKTHRQLSVLLAKDFVKRNEVELNA